MYLLERWENQPGTRTIVLSERIDEMVAPEDTEYRLWCEEILDDEPWSYIPDVFWDEGHLDLVFRPGMYIGMPGTLSLEKPRRPALGSTLRLFREDGAVFSHFRVREGEDLDARELESRERNWRLKRARR